MIRDSPFVLPMFKGFTVDKRLRQFRKVGQGCQIKFIAFDSKEGKELLKEMKDYFSFLELEN